MKLVVGAAAACKQGDEMLTIAKIQRRQHVAVVMGTRPEAIKMAPVISALKARPDEFQTTIIVTGQHRQMLDQVLSIFNIRPDVDLAVMVDNQSLVALTGKVLAAMETTLRDVQPDILLVQGDTTTTCAAALAAFHLRIPVGHIEAGLRSHERYDPFPEEMNRRITTVLSEIHFAPTPASRAELYREGVDRRRVVVTGNTVVDALGELAQAPFDLEASPLRDVPFEGHRVLLVTSHRRESWGQGIENICLAAKQLVAEFEDLVVVFPVHLNPNVRKTVLSVLDGADRIFLKDPLDYVTFVNLMRRSQLILTDSGGVQEEAPSLGKPLLVLRQLTERPEAFRAGLARVIGTSQATIVSEAATLLNDLDAYRAMTSRYNPYGDGRAAERIVTVLQRRRQGERPWLGNEEQFTPGPPATFREIA